MKSLFILLLGVVCTYHVCQAQNDSTLLTIKYKTWISLLNKDYPLKCALYQTNDTSVSILLNTSLKSYRDDNAAYSNINIKDIDVIKVRKNNRLIKGAIIGFVSGMALGGIYGLMSGDDPPCDQGSWFCFRFTAGEKAVMAGIPLSVVGAITGLAIGSVKIKMPIHGKQENYNMQKTKLNLYTIR